MSRSGTVQLGPFDLAVPIGRGGMGEVWRATHRTQGVSVAIKVMTALRARDPDFVESFQAEVRAVARLDHPGVVMVYDSGRVSAGAARASSGKLEAGCPYLAMELADGGTLVGSPPSDWEEARRVLLALLDALAHAHARGVVHRDIKPANVLWAGRRPGAFAARSRRGSDDDSISSSHPGAFQRVVLSDFGIAHAIGSDVAGDVLWGTPQFMAPEQFSPGGSDTGPWTDLYSLGCLAYVLCQGTPPFRQAEPGAAMRAHLLQPVPRLSPRFAVPDGLDEWVRQLIAKQPSDRFQFAADAAWALQQLGEPVMGPSGGGVRPARVADAETVPLPTAHDPPADNPPPFDPQPDGQSADEERSLPPVTSIRRTVPLSTTWRRATPCAPPGYLVGAGLGLFGLRTIPLVDREEERDILWSALVATWTHKTPRVVVLRGPAGTGKSRLAEWLTERSHEVGAAVILRGSFSPAGGIPEGVARIAARHLGCIGQDWQTVRARVTHFLSTHHIADRRLADDFSELVNAGASPTNAVGFARPAERYRAFARMLELLGVERPVVVWFDEVQWGADAIAFAEYLLEHRHQHPIPVLVMMTLRDEALAEREDERSRLDRVLKHSAATVVVVPPLPERYRPVLVRNLLGLSGDLAQRVADRTEGNPLFAVQLVRDWVERGVLEPGPGGFRLRHGEEAPFPNSLHQVWQARVDRLSPSRPQDARRALELAATLGLEVATGEWRLVCKAAGVPLPEGLQMALLQSRLAVSTERGWAFAHTMLRESLERSSHEEGRYATNQLACARMLSERHERGGRGLGERTGRHFVEGGAHQLALEPLLVGAQERLSEGSFDAAMGLLELRERSLDRLGRQDVDEERIQGWILRSHVFAGQGRFDLARRWAERARREAEAHGWYLLEARALVRSSFTDQHRGDLPVAVTKLEGALDLISPERAPGHVAACLHGLGHVARRLGQLEIAERLFERAAGLYEDLGEPVSRATSLVGAAAAAVSAGAPDRAERRLHEALEVFEAHRHRSGQADCWNGLGEAARACGDMGQAEAHYRQALSIYESAGTDVLHVPRINLAMVLLSRGSWEQAEATLSETRPSLVRSGSKAWQALVEGALAACAAGRGDWEDVDRRLADAQQLAMHTSTVDPDLARVQELTGDLAAAAGQRERADHAWAMALEQWTALRREVERKRVAEHMG